MNRPSRLLASCALVAGLLVTGCESLSTMVNPGVGGAPAAGQLADAPVGAQVIGAPIQIAAGVTPAGPYRAWVYRTDGGLSCLEVATTDGSSAGCGEQADVLIQGVSTSDTGVWVTGGTTKAGAAAIVITLQDGTMVRSALIPGPAGILPPGSSLYVVGLPPAKQPASISVIDAAGTVLETTAIQ